MPHSIGPFFPHVKYSITVYKIYKITRHFLKKKQLDISVKKIGPPKNNQWKRYQRYFLSLFYFIKILKNITYSISLPPLRSY